MFILTLLGTPVHDRRGRLVECLSFEDATARLGEFPGAVIVDTETGMPVTATAAAEQEDVEPCLP